MLKRELTPVGDESGEVFYRGKKLCELEGRASAAEIGFVIKTPKARL